MAYSVTYSPCWIYRVKVCVIYKRRQKWVTSVHTSIEQAHTYIAVIAPGSSTSEFSNPVLLFRRWESIKEFCRFFRSTNFRDFIEK